MSGREPSREHDRVLSRLHDCRPAQYVERELAASRKFDGRVAILLHSLWKVRATCNLFVWLCRSVSVSVCVQSFNTAVMRFRLLQHIALK